MFSPGFCVRISAAFLVCFLLLQLHLSFYIKDKGGPNLTSAAVKIFENYGRLSHAINKEGYYDESHSYKIIPIHRKKNQMSSFDVTYVSQCTWNRFYFLENLLDAWQGPMSIAVFAEVKFLDEVLWSLSIAEYCFRYKELDLSLVLPAQGIYIPRRNYAVQVTKMLNESELCRTGYSTDYKNTRNYNWSTPYPVNLLRNIARSRVESDYVLVADIDMIPSKNLRRNFLRYVWSRKMQPKKIVFVVPVFEMGSGIEVPKTKSEVMSESLRENVRPFYFWPCKKCQLLTNYTKWFSYPNLPGIRTLYKVDWKHPWEPFFISYRDVPSYDVRFKQYGYNRVSQICQLHMEGYSFLVLDNAFLIHQGFKSMDFHDTKHKEMTSNRQLYEEFKLELKMKHPNSNRTCDEWARIGWLNIGFMVHSGTQLCMSPGLDGSDCRSFSCRVDDMQTKNSNAVYRQASQKVHGGVENQPALPPRTSSVSAPESTFIEAPSDGYAPYAPVPNAKATGSGHAQVANPPPYRMPPHPLPPLPGAAISETPPPVSSLHTHSSKFPIEREVVLRSTDKNNKIPILSEYNKRPKSAVAPEGPTKQIAWTDNTKQFSGPDNSSSSKHSENTYISFQSGSPAAKHRQNVDLEKGGGKEDKTKITKTYHTIRDMISNRFNKPKDNIEEQKQMNNQTPANGTYGTRGGETGKVYGETSKSFETGDASEGVIHRVYGSRERLVDGFPAAKTDESFEGVQNQMKSMSIGQQRMTPRDTRVMPPLPVLRGSHHPNFSGASEILSPILPGSPISPQQQQRRLAGMQQQQHSAGYEPDSPYQLSHQQIQRKIQNQTPAPETHGTFATARAHLVTMVDGNQQRQPVYEPTRHFPNQDPIYATGSYLPPHQRRPPPPNAKPVYRAHPVELPQSEGQEGSLTANLESNGVYISKTPNPKFSENYAYSQNPIYGSRPPSEPPKQPPPPKPEKKQESETDDDGGFKTAIRSGSRGYVAEEKAEGRQQEEAEKGNQESMEKEKEEKDQAAENKQERPGSRNEILSAKADNFGSRSDLLRPDNKVSSATSSDYEKATRRSIGQGSSIGDSGRGSAAYSSGRQESGRGSVEYSSGREKPKERLDTSNESSDGIKRDGGYASQKGNSRGNDSSEWVDIVESELRQILDPKMHGLGGFGSGRGSTLSESVSSLTPPLPPLSPGGGSSPTPTPRQMRYKHSSLPYNIKGEYDSKAGNEERKFATGKAQRSNGNNGRGNWGGRTGKNGDKSRSLGSNSRNSKVPLAMFGVETDLASTTTGPLDSVLDSRLSDHTSDEDLSTTIDATDALAIRRQLQGLENMYSEVLKLLGVKKYGGRYQPTDPRGKRRYGSMSSLPSSVSSRPMRDKRRDERKKVKDIKGINKRFQRLESHVVTLARSVAHLSSEMRTQHLMIQEMENIRSEISTLRTQTSMNVRSQSVPRALNSMLVSPTGESTDPTALTNPARVKKLTKFFGDEPPLLRLFLKKLGYEKYAALFESERIGMVELPYLTEERLQKMGIPMGPRLRILQEAQISFCRDSVYVV